MERLSAANTKFSLNLFKNITRVNASGNVFYSPVSISSALAMVSLGARGNTADQMFRVLGFNNPSANQIHSSFNRFMSELNHLGDNNTLSLANRLYGEQTYEILDRFQNDAERYYGARLRNVDFRRNPEAARETINRWVEGKTNDKIRDLVLQGVITSSTKLFLVNAIYFNGEWETKFRRRYTSDEQFKVNRIQRRTVRMMHQDAMFRLGSIREMNSQVLELPYVGGDLSMLIILPNEIEDETTGLQRIERALTYENLMEWTSRMDPHEVQVSLPKFRIDETYDMKSLLTSMGMKDVFDPDEVNLSGMSSSNELVLSEVIHKAIVAVDEKGTEADAATTTSDIPLRRLRPPRTFIADHPFLYLIRHNPSKAILFFGRLCSP